MKSISYIKNVDEWMKGFSFSIPIRIRFSETDMFGHVNNVSPFIYFEEARIEYLKSLGFETDEKQANIAPIVADLQCDYLKQMYFGNNINMYVKINTIGNTSCDIHYMAKDELNEVCLTGRGRLVCIDREKGVPTPLPEEMKEAIKKANEMIM